jgi:S1-C subfamily serine protease
VRLGQLFLFGLFFLSTVAVAELPETVARIKPSIVAVGTFKQTNSPQFTFRGTGFAVDDGTLIATNAHVIPESTDPDGSKLAIQIRGINGELTVWRAELRSRDKEHDLAILKIEGRKLPSLRLANSDAIQEGQGIGFIGFPIGGALGFSPVTHRGIVSSITPIALPGGNAQQLNQRLIRQLKNGAFNIFQLDATAYPGNSGSPVFDIESGTVIGVINMVFIKGSKESALSQPSGISYAIPASYLKRLLDQP